MIEHPIHGSPWFDVRELVSPEDWTSLGSRAESLIDPKLVHVLDKLRTILGYPIIVNDWHIGGQYKLSGYRNRLVSIGGFYSQHRHGRAGDIKVPGLSSRSVAKVILSAKNELMPLGLSVIEDPDATPTWTHLDVRFLGPQTDIRIVRP